MFCPRFHIKVTAVWGQGSNADIALDDIAIGAACFDTGKLLLTHHHDMLDTVKSQLMAFWSVKSKSRNLFGHLSLGVNNHVS